MYFIIERGHFSSTVKSLLILTFNLQKIVKESFRLRFDLVISLNTYLRVKVSAVWGESKA